MREDKYVIEPDFNPYQVGFRLKSKIDDRREKLERELSQYSNKSTISVTILSIFPIMGLHRMTNGKFFSGLLFACTAGGFFIWWLGDMIKIGAGKFTDEEGRYINSSKVTELTMELDNLASHYSTEEYVYHTQREAKRLLEKAEYLTICEELGYE